MQGEQRTVLENVHLDKIGSVLGQLDKIGTVLGHLDKIGTVLGHLEKIGTVLAPLRRRAHLLVLVASFFCWCRPR